LDINFGICNQLEWVDHRQIFDATGWTSQRQGTTRMELLDPKEKSTYQTAAMALKEQLNPGNQSLAALGFCL